MSKAHHATATAENSLLLPSNTPSIDDIQSDIWHLFHLLDVLVMQMVQMPHVRDGQRDTEMDQASALAWVARDLTHRLAYRGDELVNEAASVRAAQQEQRQ